MQRSSTRFLILGILVMAILAIVASSLVLDFSNTFQNSEVEIAEAATSGQFSAGTKANYYGLADGNVPDGYSHGMTGTVNTVTALSGIAGKTSGQYILTSNIGSSNSPVALNALTTNSFNGTFDGQGHTIYFTNTKSTSYDSSAIVGSIFGQFTGGTIKNVNFVFSFTFTNTNSEPKYYQAWGGIIGKMSGGKIENCTFTLRANSSWSTNVQRGQGIEGQAENLGVICGEFTGGTMEKVTVNMQTYSLTFTNTKSSGFLSWPAYRASVGAFAGISYGTIVFKNISLYGSGTIQAVGNGSNGEERCYVGGILGRQSDGSAITINGLKYSYSGDVTYSNMGGTAQRGSISGELGKTITGISNIFYTSSSKIATIDDYYTSSYQNISDGHTYSIADSKLGFVGDNLWVGDLSNKSGSGTSITGNYVKTVTIGGSAIDVSSLAATGVSSAYVPCIAKSNVDGNITAYAATGKYAYLANEATNIQLTYNDATPTVSNLTPTSNAASTQYNAYTATPVVTEKIYRGGSQDTTINLSSWTYSGSIKEVGTYNMTKSYGSGLWNSNNYYLISAGSFTASVTITKKTGQLSFSPNPTTTDWVYNGLQGTGATVREADLTGFLTGDSASEEVTSFTLSNNSNTSTFTYEGAIGSGNRVGYAKATHTGTYRVTYTIEFTNYATVTNTLEYTISQFTQANAVFNFSSSQFYDYETSGSPGVSGDAAPDLTFTYSNSGNTNNAGTISKTYNSNYLAFPAYSAITVKDSSANSITTMTSRSLTNATGSTVTEIKNVTKNGNAVSHYTLTYNLAADAVNGDWAAMSVVFSITINQAIINPTSITNEAATLTYTGAYQAPSPEVPSEISSNVVLYYFLGRESDSSKTNSTTSLTNVTNTRTTSIVNVGEYAVYVSVSGQLDSPNYDVQAGWINFIIQPAVIAPTRIEKEYDSNTTAYYINTTKTTFSGLVNDETNSVLGLSANDTIGTYASKNVQSDGSVTVSNIFTKLTLTDKAGTTHNYCRVKSSNYCMAYTNGVTFTSNDTVNSTFTPSFNAGYITKAALTIKADNKTITYGDAAPSYTITCTGFKGSETISVIGGAKTKSCSYAQGNNATTYTISLSDFTSDNYTITLQNGTLTVNKRAITVTIANKTSIYGNSLQGLTASVSSGSVYNNEVPYSLSTTATITSAAGNYPITGTNTNTTNYNITFNDGTYTITKRAITVTIDAKTSAYKSAIVSLTATITSGSKYSSDNPYSLTTTATNSSNAGEYPITGTNSMSTKYNITFVGTYSSDSTKGKYTITPILVGDVTIQAVTPTHQNGYFYSYSFSGANTAYTYTQIYNGHTTTYPSSLTVTHAGTGLSTTISRSGPSSISAIGTYTNTYTLNNSNYQVYSNGVYSNIVVTVTSTISDRYRLESEGTYAATGSQFGGVSGTGISTWNGTYANSSGTYYLTSDLNLTSSQTYWHTSYVFSGTLYGNNHTIYINQNIYEDTGSMSDDIAYGFLFGKLTGTIRDVNIVVTSCGYKRSGKLAQNRLLEVGVIAGRIEGGTIENVNITYNNSKQLAYCKMDSADTKMAVGILAGTGFSATVKNCTITINNEINAYGKKDGVYNDPYIHCGVLFGSIGAQWRVGDSPTTGSADIQNVTIKGAGRVYAEVSNDTKDKSIGATGLIIGNVWGTLTINGIKLGGWTGTLTSKYNNGNGSIGAIGRNAGTVTINNLYYTPNQGYTGLNANATINYSVSYAAALENSFAFSPELGTASFYITLPNTYSTTGKYTVKVKNGSTTTNVYNISAPAKQVVYYVLDKANQAGTIEIDSGTTATGSYGVWTISPTGTKTYDHVEEPLTLTSNAKASNNTVIEKSNNTTSYTFYPNACASTVVAQSAIGSKTGATLMSFTSDTYGYNSTIINADTYRISIASGYEDAILYEDNGAYATFFPNATGQYTHTITPKALTINNAAKSEYYDPRGVTTQSISDWGIVSGLIAGDEANSPVTFTIKDSQSTTLTPTNNVYYLDVGTYTVVVAVGGANSNYSVTGGGANVSLTINQVTVAMILAQNAGFTSNPTNYISVTNGHPYNVAFNGSLASVGSPNYTASGSNQFTYTQTYNSYSTTFGLHATNKIIYNDYEIPFTFTNNTITNYNASAYSISAASNDSNFQTMYLNISATISKYDLIVTFTDCKELYDSRVDYDSAHNAFDFIYVLGDSGIPNQNQMFTDPWLTSITYNGVNITSYKDLLGPTNDAYNVLTHAGAAMVLSEPTYTAYNKNAAGEYQMSFTVTISGSNLSNFTTANGTSFTANTFTTTGSASSYSQGVVQVGESAKQNAILRLKLLSPDVRTGSDTSLNADDAWSHAHTAITNSDLMKFMATRYYDTQDLFGNTIATTYARATQYNISIDINFDDKILAAMTLPAYKTINGNGHTFTSKYGGDETNQIEGARINDAESNLTVGANLPSPESDYPASVYLAGDSAYKYYAVGDFVALNFGTIRNLTVDICARNDYNMHYYNGIKRGSAYGVIAGINMGTIDSCNVYISRPTTYAVGNSGYQTAVGGAIGINGGKANEIRVLLYSTFSVVDKVNSTSSYNSNSNIIVGGIIGINARSGDATGIYFSNYGSLRVGNPVDGQSNSDVASNTEKNRHINSVTFGGLIGINAGGGMRYAGIRGEGTILINSKYYTPDQFLGYISVGKISSEEYANTWSSLYTKSGEVYTAVPNDSSYNENTVYYMQNYGDVYSSLFNIRYLHFAIGIGVSNNVDGTHPTYGGVTVYDCVENNVNKVGNIMLDYTGTVQFYAENYMAGLAFAKASSGTHVDVSGHRYSSIIWNDNYNSDMELFTVNPTYTANANVCAHSPSAGLSIMGWVDAIGTDANFMGGMQIITNTTDLGFYWEMSNSAYTGNLRAISSETGMKPKAPITSIGAYYLPSGDELINILNNTNYYTFTQTSESVLLFKMAALEADGIIVNNDTSTYKGNVIKIEVVFNYPYVEINDVYQLVQFLWFDSSDANLKDTNHSGTYLNIKNYYLQTYLNNIKMLINNNIKYATRANPYGAWVEMNYQYIDYVLAHYSEDDYYILYYNSKYYYIFLEKYYDEDGDEIPYYTANIGRLGSDITLDKYGSATPDFGFASSQWQTFPDTKSLDGQGHEIELIVKNYTTTSYNASAMATTKWYINNGDDSNSNWLSEQWLDDVDKTPSKDQTCFIFGGFVGINRGTISNINFSFREGTVFNVADSSLSALRMSRHVYIGLVSGYSTGTIDGCTLTMEDNTQLFVHKYLPSLDNNFFNPKSDKDYYGGVFMGGFAGLLGQYGIISNSTVDMGANVKLGTINEGNNGIGKGHIYSYVGGFTGMMLGGSQVFNAKIEGSATSKIFASINNQNFTRVVSAAGGLVGVNSTYSMWNQWGLGEGIIDGVIYNWKGKTISAYWNGGLKLWGWEPNLGGDRSKLTLYELGGNVVGAIGYSENDAWTTSSSEIKDLYYTFNVVDYKLTNSDKETQVTLRYYNGNGNSTSETTLNLYNDSSNNSYVLSANVAVSDAINSSDSLNDLVKVLSIFEIPYSGNATDGMNDSATNGSGIKIVGGTKNTYNNGKAEVTTGYTSLTKSALFTKLTTMGDLLSWAGPTRNANILCSFNAGSSNPSSIMWQISIVNAVSETGSFLQNPDSGTAVTVIPVYKFAQSLEEAQAYKRMDYTILRGTGDGMELYYCMGDSAVLAPDRTYYTNEVTEDKTVYYPLKALMYDGVTSGETTAFNVYDSDGVTINRVSSNVNNILTDAGSCIERQVEIFNGTKYIPKGENAKVEDIGTYRIKFNIYANEFNENAYVASKYRIMFFNATGEESTREYSYEEDEETLYKYYVKRGNSYYEKITDEVLIAHLDNVSPVNNIYTYDAVTYTKSRGAYYKYVAESNGTILAALADAASKVETYTINLVIAPISINVTKVVKAYDGYKDFNKVIDANSNYSLINATIDETFTYTPLNIPTQGGKKQLTSSSVDGTIKLTASGYTKNVNVIPVGEYDRADIGDRTAYFEMAGSVNYTLYKYDNDAGAWVTMDITQYYLKDAQSRNTYFTLASMTTLQDSFEATHREVYGYGQSINIETFKYEVRNSTTCQVKIVKGDKISISFDGAEVVLDYTYDGGYIDYVTGRDLLSHIIITTPLGDQWAANSENFKAGDFTIAIANNTQIKDASTTRYAAPISVTYNGTDFAAPDNNPTTLTNMYIWVHPAELTVVRAVKDYDGNTNSSNATIILKGFKGDDTQATLGTVSGTFGQSNIGKDIAFTLANTSAMNNVHGTNYANALSYTVSSTTYKNYYVASNPTNVGTIAPIAATILNAYKEFDGTNAVTYGAGATDTKILVKAGATGTGAVLDIKPNGATYSTNQVGNCYFNTTLLLFTYVDGTGASQTRYVVKNGNNMTNYYINGATGVNYQASASILPKAITISNVYKEYDGTNALGTFTISGKIAGDAISTFDGHYASADVVYNSSASHKYNDVVLTGTSLTLNTFSGTSTNTTSFVVLTHNGYASNYYMTTGDNVSVSTNYTIAGEGVIIPAAIEVTKVVKYYDGAYTFNTASIYALNDNNVYATVSIGGTPNSTFVFTGTMTEKDACDSCDVTVDTVTFSFDGNYNWIDGTNYRVGAKGAANPSFTGAGQILQLTIKADGASSNSGSIYDIYLGGVKINSAHYSTNTQVYEATYNSSTSYSTFNAKLKIGSTVYNITNGSTTIDGKAVTFTLTTNSNAAVGNAAKNAGIYTYTISMATTDTNFVLDDTGSNNRFYFGINRKTAENAYLITSNFTKVYNGTSTAPALPQGTWMTAVIKEGDTTIASNIAVSNPTRTVGANCVNAGIYSQGNGTSYISFSGQVSFNTTNPTTYVRASDNYKYSGTINTTTGNKAYLSDTISNNNLVTYTITKADLTPKTTVVKDFDGITSFNVELSGVNNETVTATYTYTPSTTGLNVLPGTYTGSVNVTHTSTTNYNTVNAQNITLTINKAKIVLERHYYETSNSIDYYKLVLAITNVKGLDFMTFVNNDFTAGMVTSIESSGINAPAATLTEFVDTLNDLFVFKANGAATLTEITIDMIDAINVASGLNSTKTLEIVMHGEGTLDNVTISDRYEAYMRGTTLVSTNYILSDSAYGSNVATSSSELADGQYVGTMYTTGTEIDTLAKLNTFMEAGTGTAYLTKNIYGYSATAANAAALSGTLDGNGYTIEIIGGYVENTEFGAFVAKNSGTIRNVNFKFVSDKELDANGKTVGLLVGENTGTIENVSLDIGCDINVKDQTTPIIGGVAGTMGTGSVVTNVTVTFSSNVTYAGFGGLANTITAGTITYITVRNNATCTSLAGKALVNTTTPAIDYVIDAITFTDTIKTTGTIADIYGQGGTALSMFSNGYTQGYIDYYFTTKNKFTTGGNLHNAYDASLETNVNKSYYYGDTTANGTLVAIEVIAPINRFIWEAFDAYYTTYSTSLNRAVGLYALSNENYDTPAELVTAAPVNNTFNTTGATKFIPVIGIIASTVISDSATTIQEYEYTGSTIVASFAATSGENEITLFISGTDVGIYTEYYQEIDHQQSVSGMTWDVANYTARILTSESSVGEQAIMLIIVPKELTDSPETTKQYDSTNIAEKHFDVDSNGTTDLYAVGQYNNTQVGSGYQIQYKTTTKNVAAYDNGAGTYTYVTYYLSGYDNVASKHIYTVKYIYINGSTPFTTSVNVSSLNVGVFAQAYYQLATIEEIEELANNANNQIIYANNIGSLSNLKSVPVYDLTFARTVDNTTHEVTGYSAVNYSATLYLTNGTRTENYSYRPVTNAFNGSSIMAPSNSLTYNEVELTSSSYAINTYYTRSGDVYTLSTTAYDSNETYYEASASTLYTVITNTGVITKRTIPATYSNINQSYRFELSPITIQVANIEDLDNLPYSLTAAQKSSLISALNTELNGGTSFSGDVLADTYDAAMDAGTTEAELGMKKVGNAYYAYAQEYTEIELEAITGTYSVTDNLAVSFAEGATLTLRYFKYHGYDNTLHKDIYKIETFEDLLMVDDDEADYQDLDYIVVNNLNGKGKLVSTFTNTFNGTINGNSKAVRNFVLTGTSATSLFGTLGTDVSIKDLAFLNVMLIATQNNAVLGVVANSANGTLQNVKVDALAVSDNAYTLKPFGVGTVTTSTAVIETTKNITVDDNVVTAEKPNTIILYRTYGLSGNVAFRLSTANESSRATLETTAKAILKTNRLNTAVTISNVDVVTINNFREYWVWVNIFRYLTPSNSVTITAGVVTAGTFTGHEFVI